MYTAFDKAIVAAIMGIIGLLSVLGIKIGVSETVITTIVSIATPILVYFIPNIPKDPTT